MLEQGAKIGHEVVDVVRPGRLAGLAVAAQVVAQQLELTRELKIEDMQVPIRNKR